MVTTDSAVSNCREECVSSFEDNYLDDFIDQAEEYIRDNPDWNADDIVDAVFSDNSVDDDIDGWIDEYCYNLEARGEEEELVYSYGIDSAIDSFQSEYGQHCCNMIYGIMHELMDSSEVEACIDEMKDMLYSHVEEKIEEINEQKKDVYDSIRNTIKHLNDAESEICSKFEDCNDCPLFIPNLDANKPYTCSIERLVEQCNKKLEEEDGK